MEGTFQGQDFVAIRVTGRGEIPASEFNGRLIGLGPAVGKEDGFVSRQAGQPLSQIALGRLNIEIAGVDGFSGLLPDGFHHDGMAMPQGVHGHARNAVQVTPALGVEDKRTLTADDDEIAVAVYAEKGGGEQFYFALAANAE